MKRVYVHVASSSASFWTALCPNGIQRSTLQLVLRLRGGKQFSAGAWSGKTAVLGERCRRQLAGDTNTGHMTTHGYVTELYVFVDKLLITFVYADAAYDDNEGHEVRVRITP